MGQGVLKPCANCMKKDEDEYIATGPAENYGPTSKDLPPPVPSRSQGGREILKDPRVQAMKAAVKASGGENDLGKSLLDIEKGRMSALTASREAKSRKEDAAEKRPTRLPLLVTVFGVIFLRLLAVVVIFLCAFAFDVLAFTVRSSAREASSSIANGVFSKPQSTLQLSVKPDHCLGSADGVKVGAIVVLQLCDSSDKQEFLLDIDGTIRAHSKPSLCLTVDTVAATFRECSNASGQIFDSAAGNRFNMRANPSLCISVNDQNLQDGNLKSGEIALTKCDSAGSAFTIGRHFDLAHDLEMELMSVHQKLALNVVEGALGKLDLLRKEADTKLPVNTPVLIRMKHKARCLVNAVLQQSIEGWGAFKSSVPFVGQAAAMLSANIDPLLSWRCCLILSWVAAGSIIAALLKSGRDYPKCMKMLLEFGAILVIASFGSISIGIVMTAPAVQDIGALAESGVVEQLDHTLRTIANADQCLTIAAPLGAHSPLSMSPCSAVWLDAQEFKLDRDGTIRPRFNSSLCATWHREHMMLLECSGGSGQVFDVEYYESHGSIRCVSGNDGRCLAVEGHHDGLLLFSTCDQGANEVFTSSGGNTAALNLKRQVGITQKSLEAIPETRSFRFLSLTDDILDICMGIAGLCFLAWGTTKEDKLEKVRVSDVKLLRDLLDDQDAQLRTSLAPAAAPAASQQSAMVNGCGCKFDLNDAEKSGELTKTDPIQEHYKKGGMFGAVTGAFGDKKTMYCHHITATGQIAVRAAATKGIKCKSADDVWKVLGKKPCHGRFAYDRASGKLVCGSCVEKDHDATCNKDTCLFVASGLACPTPRWAIK